MDPQQRLLLEVAWEALEDAGHAAASAWRAADRRLRRQLTRTTTRGMQFARRARTSTPTPAPGTAHSIVANRLSYLLDLRGPSIAVDTACSSSLVAVHLACQSLRNGECDLALAGGVNLLLSPALERRAVQARHAVARRPLQDLRRRAPTATCAARAAASSCSSACPTRSRDGDRVWAVDPRLGGQPGRPHQRAHRAERARPAGA